jgi:signal peptidase I
MLAYSSVTNKGNTQMMTLIEALKGYSFPAILLVLVVFTGAMWLLDRFVWAKKRHTAANAAVAQFEASSTHMTAQDKAVQIEHLRQTNNRMPWWLEYSAGFFTVILAVFVLRSFVAEPFRIPSASMMPTLQNGDLILVNKFTWGLRMPVFHTQLISTGQPDRGDVIVFRYPPDETKDYIKRVVGLPGDVVEYENKVLSINGKAVNAKALPDVLDITGEATNSMAGLRYTKDFDEALPKKQGGEKTHRIFNNPMVAGNIPSIYVSNHSNACAYTQTGVKCTVPAGNYFAMGDNRDNSVDSRYWGFVPERNIVGKAFFIWMNLDGKFNRLGGFE